MIPAENEETGITPVESQMLMLDIAKLKESERRRDVGLVLLFGFFLYALFPVTRSLTSAAFGAAYLSSLVSLVLMISFCVLTARALLSRRVALLNLGLAALFVLPVIVLPISAVVFKWSGWGMVFGSSLWKGYVFLMRYPEIKVLTKIWFASAMGAALSQVIREFKILLPAAIVLALMDLYVVFGGGLVTQAQSGNSPVAAVAMKALTIPTPRLPQAVTGGAAPLALDVGFADFLFIALFFACFAKFEIPSRRTLYVLLATLCGYMIVVALQGIALPALVPIATVVIGMNLRRFEFTAEEKKAMGIAGLIVAIVLGLLVWKSKH